MNNESDNKEKEVYFKLEYIEGGKTVKESHSATIDQLANMIYSYLCYNPHMIWIFNSIVHDAEQEVRAEQIHKQNHSRNEA